MPIYEYECCKCYHIFQKLMDIKDFNKKSECPCCGKEASRIISSGQAFDLKGKGWYQNDYGNKKPKTN